MVLNIFAFIFGAIVGSFLNACIYRLPAGESIVKPFSRCPHCRHRVRFYDNIPLVSVLLLRAKCRDCGGKISWRYPLVELVSAVFSLLLFIKFGLTLNFVVFFIFTAVLIIITFIDLDHQIIPDVLTLPGIVVFTAAAIFIVGLPWLEALIGVIVGGGVLFVIGLAYKLVKKIEGMGGGDVKLLAMIGGFFGWKSLIFVLLIASLAGAVVGITAMIIEKKDMKYAVPFGPFLSAGAVAYIFLGDVFSQWVLIP